MKSFLDKYTRFMTKDIYISKNMNQEFLDGYLYLKGELEKNKYLYQDSIEYKKFFRIFEHNSELLRLHNEKYLKNFVKKEDSFFEGFADCLNKSQMMSIVLDEDNVVVISKKNYISLISSKLKYMNDYLKLNLKKVMVLVTDDEDLDGLKKELSIYDVDDVFLDSISHYSMSCLEKNESMVQEKVLYDALFKYIVLDIYADKKHFNKFYKAFSNDIYLNRDYQDFDTFHDYHCYLYKRMFLESKLSLRKYNERETKKRRGQLRTIDNVYVSCREDVDVGNFLYLNCVDYQYDSGKFVVSSNSSSCVISFEDVDDKDKIILNKNDKYLEVLAYELVKRQYGMERRSDDDIYAMIRDTTMDSYFSEFIRDVLIPSIYYYQEHNGLNDTDFTKEQCSELEIIYNYYVEFMKEHHYVDKYSIQRRVQDRINGSKYEYYISLGSSDFSFPSRSFIVLKNYPVISFIKENVKFLYDYRSYVNDKKCLAVSHVFNGMDELNNLTSEFMKDNLDYLNQKMKENKKSIYISFYDEENKLRSTLNMVSRVASIVSEEDRETCFAFLSKGDMRVMFNGGYFIKKSQDVLESHYGSYKCVSLSTISKKYDIIILPNLISSSYCYRLSDMSEFYRVKFGLFMALDKCRYGVYLLCPNSKSSEYLKMFEGINNVNFVNE